MGLVLPQRPHVQNGSSRHKKKLNSLHVDCYVVIFVIFCCRDNEKCCRKTFPLLHRQLRQADRLPDPYAVLPDTSSYLLFRFRHSISRDKVPKNQFETTEKKTDEDITQCHGLPCYYYL